MNLLKETVKVLNEHGKSLDDIIWIGSKDCEIDKDQFIKFANKEYDRGYGLIEVAEDLVIVGKDWWLERHEYDGSEWWEYKRLPIKPNIMSSTCNIFVSDYKYTLKELNNILTTAEAHTKGYCKLCGCNIDFCEQYNNHICCLTPDKLNKITKETK